MIADSLAFLTSDFLGTDFLGPGLLSNLTMVWIALPFFVAFSIYLLPKLDRVLALGMALLSGVYAGAIALSPPLDLTLQDSFGVTLQIDAMSSGFILTNALVTAAVILYCWYQSKSAFFYIQAIALHGSVNAVFICADFISLYVALEVISVAAFLLIAYPRTNRTLWVGLRYLFVSNTVMLFYLLGAVLVYKASRSFAFAGMAEAPAEAIALIFLGLLTKGGIFVSGLWLPLTHSEADTPVSALLSGAVVTTGVFPLVRCVQLVPELEPVVAVFGVGTALLGVVYALFEADTKRMLAASTISQLGFVLAAPAAAGGYALSHGLAKASLFLLAGNLPSRQFTELRRSPLPLVVWSAVAIASLSISGAPLLAGFGAKAVTLKAVAGWKGTALTLASVGTAIAFARFIFLPRAGRQPEAAQAVLSQAVAAQADPSGSVPSGSVSPETPQIGKGLANPGLKLAIALLLGVLLLLNIFYLDVYSAPELTKALLTLGGGWLLYGLAQTWLKPSKWAIAMPRMPERLEHLIGGMSLILTVLFWRVLL